jgi:hypothetical protein
MRPPRKSGSNQDKDQLRRIAVEAARVIAEQGIRDYHVAKHKAATRLGLPDHVALPRNAEIEDALREHQRLFQTRSQPLQLSRLREAAVEALRFFARFEPRLVGAVLDGTADQHSSVCLHLFADDPRELAAFLHSQGIPFDEQDRTLRFDGERHVDFPVFRFSAGDVPFDVTTFPLDGLRQAPLDRISGRPIQRASLDALLELLHSTKRN